MDLRTLTEAVTTLAERRENDGLAAYCEGRPYGWFKHQIKLFESEKPEAWIFGGNRSGKTEGLAGLGSSFLRFGHPDPRPSFGGNGIEFYDRAVKVWAVSLKYDLGRNIFQPKMFNNGAGIPNPHPFIPDSEIANWNVTNQTLQLKNGSVCNYKSCDAGRDAFPGDAIDVALFDEVPDPEVYKEVGMRVGGGRRLLIRGAATILPPAGEPGGVTWLYDAKVRPWKERGGDDPKLDIFTAGTADNPAISEDEIARMSEMFPPGSPEYLIRIKGALLPSIGGTLVYPGFTRSFHMNSALAPRDQNGVPRPHVLHFLPLCLAVDFNPTNGKWIIGQYINGIFRVIDGIALERSDIMSMTHEFRSKFPAHGAELWVYGDATGRRREGQTGEASFYLIQEYLQGYPSPIRFMLPSVNPPVKDRVAATNRALRPGDGSKKIEIASHLDWLAHELESTKWKANGTIDKTAENQSNGADALGYWVSYVEPVPRYTTGGVGLKSIKSPKYIGRGESGQVFPASRPVRIGNRWYGARRLG